MPPTRFPPPGETLERAFVSVPVRAGLAAALDYQRSGDTLILWKLDRLGRWVKNVLTICDDLPADALAAPNQTSARKARDPFPRPCRRSEKGSGTPLPGRKATRWGLQRGPHA